MFTVCRFGRRRNIFTKFYGTLSQYGIRNNSDLNIVRTDENVEIPKATVDEIILNEIPKWPKHIATECALTGRKYTFEDVYKKTKNFDKSLRKKLKLNKGDVIGVILPNSPEYCIIMLGALKAGLVVTTVNPIYSAEEIAKQLIDSSAKALVTQSRLWDLVKKAANLAKKNIPILTIKNEESESLPQGAINLFEFFEDTLFSEATAPKYDDVAVLPYSSGTTGFPKGVQLTHHNVLASLFQVNTKNVTLINATTNESQDIVPAILPQFHIYGLMTTIFNTTYLGCKCVILPQFTPDLYLNVLKNYNVHVLYIVPPLALFMASHPAVTRKELESVRYISSGAAPLGALDQQKLTKKMSEKTVVLQGYGLTESAALVSLSKPTEGCPVPEGSVGKPVPNTAVKVIDTKTGESLGPNSLGELLIKAPQIMKGYHNRPEETRDSFLNGWFRTGDLAYYDANGFLFITDRLKELIKVKGFQVAPAELEEILRDFTSVADAAVIGVPHETHGEVPRAFVLPKNGQTVDVDALHEFVAAKVAPYKQLKGGITIVDDIPKNAAGKILRRQLKLKYVEN